MDSSGAGGSGHFLQDGRLPLEYCRMFAGLETGIVCGAAMLAWVGVAGMLVDRQPFWIVPNLLASLFYGASALRHGFSTHTVSGLALHAFVSAVLGMAFALLVRDYKRRGRLALVGILVALVWYHLSVTLIWHRLGALASLYVSPTSLLPGHLIFGVLLARYPAALDSISRHFGWTPAPAPVPAVVSASEPPASTPPAETTGIE